MTLNEKINNIIIELMRLYDGHNCSLKYTKPYELLIAARLSAQCTDERVNLVTPSLFKSYPTLQAFAQADFNKLCKMIYSTGFYKNKAISIIEMSRHIIERFNGVVPDNIEDLITLPGVGRKTANLIIGDIYGKPSVVVDTHCIRLSNRLGLVQSLNPVIIEKRLKKILPLESQTDFCHNLVFHGRAICTARSPKCNLCTLLKFCSQRI